MCEISHREMSVRLAWIEQQSEKEWTNPTPTQYYLMRVAQRTIQARCARAADARKVTLEQQKVVFRKPTSKTKTPKPPVENVNPKMFTAFSKQVWLARTSLAASRKARIEGTMHNHGS